MWNVYSADRHLVATYSTEMAAAAHVASWPALYYSLAVGPQPPPVSFTTGLDCPPDSSTGTKSDG